MYTLNTVFKQVFGEALEPLGFKKIKGRYPYFVRLIGDEIIHVVTYMPRPDKHFVVLGGVATVYRQRLSLDECPRNNQNWLNSNWGLYRDLNVFDFDSEFGRSIYEFYYYDDTEYNELKRMNAVRYNPWGGIRQLRTVTNAVEHSLRITKEIMLPILGNASNLNSCIEYFYKFKLNMYLNYDKEDFGNKNLMNYYNEGLLHIKTDSLIDYQKFKEEQIQKELFEFANDVEKDIYAQGTHEALFKKYEEEKPQRMRHYEEVFNDHEWHENARTELERRKAANIKILKSYGLDV